MLDNRSTYNGLASGDVLNKRAVRSGAGEAGMSSESEGDRIWRD